MAEQRIDPRHEPAGRPVRRGFRDPNETAVREVGIKLLREILDYQQRLNRLLEQAVPERAYLVNAYRRAIRVRREMLRDLPDDRAGPHPAGVA